MNWRVSKSTVATLMAETGVVARRKRRRPVRPHRTSPPQGARRAAPRFHPGRSGRTCSVRGFTETPTDVGKLHSRRCWICILGAHTDTRHWIVHCVQPTPASIPPPVIRRQSQIQWSTWWCRPPTKVRFGAHYGFGRWVRGGWVSVCRGAC